MNNEFVNGIMVVPAKEFGFIKKIVGKPFLIKLLEFKVIEDKIPSALIDSISNKMMNSPYLNEFPNYYGIIPRKTLDINNILSCNLLEIDKNFAKIMISSPYIRKQIAKTIEIYLSKAYNPITMRELFSKEYIYCCISNVFNIENNNFSIFDIDITEPFFKINYDLFVENNIIYMNVSIEYIDNKDKSRMNENNNLPTEKEVDTKKEVLEEKCSMNIKDDLITEVKMEDKDVKEKVNTTEPYPFKKYELLFKSINHLFHLNYNYSYSILSLDIYSANDKLMNNNFGSWMLDKNPLRFYDVNDTIIGFDECNRTFDDKNISYNFINLPTAVEIKNVEEDIPTEFFPLKIKAKLLEKRKLNPRGEFRQIEYESTIKFALEQVYASVDKDKLDKGMIPYIDNYDKLSEKFYLLFNSKAEFTHLSKLYKDIQIDLDYRDLTMYNYMNDIMDNIKFGIEDIKNIHNSPIKSVDIVLKAIDDDDEDIPLTDSNFSKGFCNIIDNNLFYNYIIENKIKEVIEKELLEHKDGMIINIICNFENGETDDLSMIEYL